MKQIPGFGLVFRGEVAVDAPLDVVEAAQKLSVLPLVLKQILQQVLLDNHALDPIEGLDQLLSEGNALPLEIDMVLNIGALKESNYKYVLDEIAAAAKAASGRSAPQGKYLGGKPNPDRISPNSFVRVGIGAG